MQKVQSYKLMELMEWYDFIDVYDERMPDYGFEDYMIDAIQDCLDDYELMMIGVLEAKPKYARKLEEYSTIIVAQDDISRRFCVEVVNGRVYEIDVDKIIDIVEW